MRLFRFLKRMWKSVLGWLCSCLRCILNLFKRTLPEEPQEPDECELDGCGGELDRIHRCLINKTVPEDGEDEEDAYTSS